MRVRDPFERRTIHPRYAMLLRLSRAGTALSAAEIPCYCEIVSKPRDAYGVLAHLKP